MDKSYVKEDPSKNEEEFLHKNKFENVNIFASEIKPEKNNEELKMFEDSDNDDFVNETEEEKENESLMKENSNSYYLKYGKEERKSDDEILLQTRKKDSYDVEKEENKYNYYSKQIPDFEMEVKNEKNKYDSSHNFDDESQSLTDLKKKKETQLFTEENRDKNSSNESDLLKNDDIFEVK